MESEAINEVLSERLVMQGGITSAIVIAAFVILRFSLVHLIRRQSEILDKDQRRWINRINNAASIAIVVSLVLIWAPQLQTFALSLTAVAVAIVLTTKELLMCLTGGFLRASTKPFDVGDWITVDGLSGEVMQITAMTTLLQKVNVEAHTFEFTGETIQIPNSRFLTANVQNANFIKSYIYHEIPLTVPFGTANPVHLMNELKDITSRHYAPYRDEALDFNRKIERKAAIDFADPDPQFFLRTTDVGNHLCIARVFVPTGEAASIGNRIAQDFLAFVHKQSESVAGRKSTGGGQEE